METSGNMVGMAIGSVVEAPLAEVSIFLSGGIGVADGEALAACTGCDRVIASVSNANEIFFCLDGRRVYFDRAAGFLYFVTGADDRVARTIRASLTGHGRTPVFEQLHLDSHGLFNGARRVALEAPEADAVLIALRLSGVRATVR